MENFQYSVQLSDQDWAEFSAAAEECGLLQAGLASGDELLSGDTDHGDSSDSSPPGPRPLPGGRGWRDCEEEDQAAPQPLVSRSWQEPVLAPGAGQQMPSTSARSEARPSLSSGAAPPDHSTSLPGPVSSRDEMQRLLQGPAPRDPAPKPPGEPPPSPESPGRSAAPQRAPGSPGALPRSPSRKKRRAAGAKAGGRSGAAGSASSRLGSPLLAEARPQEDLGPAGATGKDAPAGTAERTAGAWQDERGPESAGAPEPVARPGPGLDVSPPVPSAEQGTDPLRMTPRADLHPVSTPAREPFPDFSAAKSDTALSGPASQLPPGTAVSAPACEPRLDVDRPTPGPEVKPDVDSSAPASKPQSDVEVPTPAPAAQAGPALGEAEAAPPARLGSGPIVSPGGHPERPTREPSAAAPACALEEPPPGPIQASKKKKVRFSVTVPSPEEPGSGEASRPLSPATAWPSAPRTAAGGRGAPGAWDAVAVGPRLPQSRILKHLPPPAPSASGGLGYRSCFAVTVPEAYEFFFCDTIEEEDEGAEEVAEASEVPAQVQWPEVCEFFFRDSQGRRSGHRGGQCPAPAPATPGPAPLPGDPVPISIPEAYEHFLGEDRLGAVPGPAAPLQLQAAEARTAAPPGVEPGTRPERSLAAVGQLDLVLRPAEKPRGPLASLAFSQNDMCLVFVAFATWAVRTSDLHTPDAWKTVLLANIGTISAIRYFRRQVGRGRRSPSPGPSPSS
ncbi:PGC-1 and ERR-induced regulator in muscle protein 1 [Pteronotus mesoamericanus]|uniref:PGC-1 and ERR-induced regulator in muscle protein 1 n=1 Tax=Pteronotus mesoamericanus TaxID=1884717 RepID=UPI0023ED880A|nr:PGC-1 and ERR-induced regulator in muscle protein 1 [Pteronotus parnellii mesoamericanus]